MPYALNNKLKGLQPYQPVCEDYEIRLDANESFLQPSAEKLSEILSAVARVEFNRYPDPTAALTCKAFANYYDIDSRYVTAGNGSDELLYIIATAFSQKGDTVITMQHDFSMYNFYSYIAECNIIECGSNEDMSVSVEDIINLCNKNSARLLFFSNPCNPTSLKICQDDILKIINSVDALVVLDEAYMDFCDDTLINMVLEFSNVILLRTCSKMIGMAAIRLGFAVANRTITEALRAAKSPYNVSSVTQAIAEIVLADKEYINNCKDIILKARDKLYEELRCISDSNNWDILKPQTNFIFLKPDNAEAVFCYLKLKGILVRQLSGYLRITVGNNNENHKLILALNEYK